MPIEEILSRIRAGGRGAERAEQQLLQQYDGLLRSTTRHYARRLSEAQEGMIEPEDLRQAGSIGLIEAARRWDPARGIGFSFWAEQYVHGYIKTELREDEVIGTSRNFENHLKVFGTLRQIIEERGEPVVELSDDEILAEMRTREAAHRKKAVARAAAVSNTYDEFARRAIAALRKGGPSEVIAQHLSLQAVERRAQTTSFDAERGEGEEEHSLHEVVVDEAASQEGSVTDRERLRAIVASHPVFSANQRRVLMARLQENAPSLAEIGRQMKVTRERARALEARARVHLDRILKGDLKTNSMPPVFEELVAAGIRRNSAKKVALSEKEGHARQRLAFLQKSGVPLGYHAIHGLFSSSLSDPQLAKKVEAIGRRFRAQQKNREARLRLERRARRQK